MKKLGVLLAIGFVLCVFTTANATLLGIKEQIANSYPDILIDTNASIVYTAGDQQLTVTGTDFSITWSGTLDDFEFMSGTDYTTRFSLVVTVDENGVIREGTMTEWVDTGTLTLESGVYTTGTILLTGDVVAMGWGEGALLGQFDFVVTDVTGAFIAGVFPNLPLGLYGNAEDLNGWAGSWDANFTLEKAKFDKASVPEPATMLLLGSGLIGLAGLARRRFHKK